MSFGALRVTPGTAQTFKFLKTGWSFEVVGDGQVEDSITDKFSTPDALTQLTDHRLRKFAAQEMELHTRLDNAPADQVTPELGTAVANTLGKGWTVKEQEGYGGEGKPGLARVTLAHDEPGGVTQRLSIEHRDNPASISLETQLNVNGYQVTHELQGNLSPAGQLAFTLETARFEGP